MWSPANRVTFELSLVPVPSGIAVRRRPRLLALKPAFGVNLPAGTLKEPRHHIDGDFDDHVVDPDLHPESIVSLIGDNGQDVLDDRSLTLSPASRRSTSRER